MLRSQSSPEWSVEVDALEAGGFRIAAEHPVSSGIVLTTPTSDRDSVIREVTAKLADLEELERVAAAPELRHERAVHGVRHLAKHFQWGHAEVSAVCALLSELSALDDDEASWLREYGSCSPDDPDR